MNLVSIFYFLGAIGVADTLYLIYHKLRGTDAACLFFPAEWCRTVQHSPQSKTFGIPNSYAGFGMYVVILMLTWLHAGGSIAVWPIQAIVTLGFLFSMYFTYVQAFVLKAFCTWCVLSAINFTAMFFMVWFL